MRGDWLLLVLGLTLGTIAICAGVFGPVSCDDYAICENVVGGWIVFHDMATTCSSYGMKSALIYPCAWTATMVCPEEIFCSTAGAKFAKFVLWTALGTSTLIAIVFFATRIQNAQLNRSEEVDDA